MVHRLNMSFGVEFRLRLSVGIVLLVLVGLLAHVPVIAQGISAPPRNVDDVLALLGQYSTNERDNGADLRKRAEQLPPDTNDKVELARFFRNRAMAKSALGFRAQYLTDLKLALDYAPPRSNLYYGLRNRVADVETSSGSLQRGLKYYLEIAETMPRANIGSRMEAHSKLSGIYMSFGDYASARAELAKMEQVFAERKTDAASALYEHERLAMIAAARAAQYEAEGKLKEAEQERRKALKEMELDLPLAKKRLAEKRFTRSLALVASITEDYAIRLARNLMQQGRLVEAEEIIRSELGKSLNRIGRYQQRIGFFLRTFAQILIAQGRNREAERLALAAIETFQKSETEELTRQLLFARMNLGASLVGQGAWSRALTEYESVAESIKQDPFMAANLKFVNFGWGLALIKTGQSEKAVAILEELTRLTSARLGDSADETAQARGFLAMALAANGNRDRALAEFRRAVPVLLSTQSSDGDEDNGRNIRSRRLRHILEAYIELLMEGLPREEAIAESFRVADAARASSVQRSLSESAARSAITDPALAALAREEQDARSRVGILTGLLGRLLSAAAEDQLPKVIAGIRSEIENLRVQRAKLKSDLERRFPEYANLVDPKPVTMQQARAALKPGEALISVYVGQNKTYVWAVPREGEAAFAVVALGERAVSASIAELRKALDFGNTAIVRFPRFDTAIAHRLYTDLLKPVETAWKDATSLIIVPHRAFGQLPFGLLVTAPSDLAADTARFDSYRAVSWLLRKAAVSQLPSVNALTTLRALPAVSGNRREFAGFGDPYFSKAQHAEAGMPQKIEVAELSANLRNLKIETIALPIAGEMDNPSGSSLRNASAIANSSTLAQLARLPETADEIRDIAQVLKADISKDVFLGVQANENNVKSVYLADRKVIAFATHGLVPGDLNGLDQPALAMTAPDVAGIDGDGLLTAEEILALKLNADWVVLSACNTGSADGAGSEAISGLGRAFFYAGARSLLVSNWPVETVSAKLLTTEVFKRSVDNPNLTRAEALRQTMLWVLDNAGQRDASGKLEFTYAHPMFWAPFALIGDGGR